MKYFCDEARHLVCVPYNIENLHIMAQDLGIKRCWFHSNASYAHYDIPKRRVGEIMSRCTVVSTREIVQLIHAQQSVVSNCSHVVEEIS